MRLMNSCMTKAARTTELYRVAAHTLQDPVLYACVANGNDKKGPTYRADGAKALFGNCAGFSAS